MDLLSLSCLSCPERGIPHKDTDSLTFISSAVIMENEPRLVSLVERKSSKVDNRITTDVVPEGREAVGLDALDAGN